MKKFIENVAIQFRKHLVIILTSIGMLLILIACLIIINFTDKEIKQLKIQKQELYQYINTERFDYNTDLVIDNSESITQLKIYGETVELDSTPFFYKNEKKVLFPKMMSVVFPKSNGIQKKVKYFSHVDGTGLDYYIKNNNLNYSAGNSFLYDGNDLYFFLTDTTITFGDQKVSIPSFSYVILNYNKELFIFNYDQQVVTYYPNVTQTVLAESNGFKVNLSIDAIMYGEKSRLLIKNFEFLDNLK